ncbi:MAG: hypothetical protein IJR84_06135 [Bacteroidaceae bacterium]|nr:hypothetical protein [Bacteroidaceae bacterium]
MKKLILFLAVIIGSLLMQSCICDYCLFGPDYGYGAPPPPPPPPPHRARIIVW